jgi:nitrous oxide reductase accessory protein NosL
MKNLLSTLILATFLISCSKDENNCDAEKQQIRDHFDTQIQYVKDHPGPSGIDYRQITLLQQERDNKIANACN